MNNIVQFLFTDPISAGANTPSGNEEVFHFYLPWIIFCALGLLTWFYYSVEGRKRLFGSHTLHKYILDRMTNQLALLSFVGLPLMAARRWMDSSLFSCRVWRYGWLLWGAILVVYWLVYFIRSYPQQIADYRRYRTMQKYIPQPKAKRDRRPAKGGIA